MFITVILTAMALLISWNYVRLHRFERDYRFPGLFGGRHYECRIGGLRSENRVLCFIGSDMSGIYLLPHPKPNRRFLGCQIGEDVFKDSILIPWTDIHCRSGRGFFKHNIRFEIPPRKIFLYVSRDIGEKLLTDAGRNVPQ